MQRFLALVLAITVFTATMPASAQVGPRTNQKQKMDEAKPHLDKAVELYDENDFANALIEFKRAYDLIPNLLVLYNIGLVYAAMDRPVEAVDALDKVLDGATGAGGPVGLTAAQAAKARQVRADQAARIAEVMVVTDKPAVLEVDGVEAGRTPLERPLRLASGAHVLSALAPGCLPAARASPTW